MNKRTSYELIIAKKAEQYTPPDMADAIWASVKMQLDQPTADTGNSSHQQPSASRIPGRFRGSRGLSYFFGAAAIVTISALVWFTFHKKHSSPPVNPAHRIDTPAVDALKKNEPAVDTAHIQRARPQYAAPVTTVAPFIDSTLRITDSVKTAPLIQVPKMDSLRNRLIVPADSAGIIPPVKKPHGVKGIQNEDYKIVPKTKN